MAGGPGRWGEGVARAIVPLGGEWAHELERDFEEVAQSVGTKGQALPCVCMEIYFDVICIEEFAFLYACLFKDALEEFQPVFAETEERASV